MTGSPPPARQDHPGDDRVVSSAGAGRRLASDSAARPRRTAAGYTAAGYAASLDHAVWFHRPFVPAEWHRYEVNPLDNADARGLVVGSM
jgi:acyl-CoA thioesterase